MWARAWGANLKEALEEVAKALFSVICDPSGIEPAEERCVEVSAPDVESLVVEFLSEVLYLFDAELLVFSEVEVRNLVQGADRYELKAMLRGEKFSNERHSPGTEVKAITYSYLAVEESQRGTTVEVVFDI